MLRVFCVLIFIFNTAHADTVVATRLIRPREVISPRDIALQDLSSPIGFADVQSVVGLEARRAIYPGRPIGADDIGPAAVIERNQIVSLQFKQNGLSIVTEARALARAAPGDEIRVMNMTSHSTLSGVAMPDGSVHVSQ